MMVDTGWGKKTATTTAATQKEHATKTRTKTQANTSGGREEQARTQHNGGKEKEGRSSHPHEDGVSKQSKSTEY